MNKKGFLLIFSLVFILALTKVFLTAKLATSGTKLAQFEKDSQQLSEKNHLLNDQILKLSSLTRISSEAAKLGFLRTEKIVTLSLEVPVALR